MRGPNTQNVPNRPLIASQSLGTSPRRGEEETIVPARPVPAHRRQPLINPALPHAESLQPLTLAHSPHAG